MNISVVVPAYNEKSYIAKCLTALTKQTKKPHEIIVVDNNSTDGTGDIIREYDVTLLRERKQGMTHSRNCGFNFATGDIIARTDADTIVPPDWIEKIQENFTKYKIDALTGPCVFYDMPFKSNVSSEFVLEFVKILLNGNETLNGPNMIVTKKIWNSVKDSVCTDDHKVHEDFDLAFHIIKAGGKIRRDSTLIVNSSARRILHNPLSQFGEYPIRGAKTYLHHMLIDQEQLKKIFTKKLF